MDRENKKVDYKVIDIMEELITQTEKKEEGSLFNPYVDAISELDIFVELAWAGFGYAAAATKVTHILRDRHADEEFYKERLKWAEKLERFANEQKNHNFSFLYALAVVRLWTILEALINDLVITLLSSFPDALQADSIRKLRGPLVEFIGATPNERAEYLMELLVQELRAKLKPGIGRFETILEAVGMGGPVADAPRRFLYELSQVRNAIVHRNGRADAKLIQNCPWLNLKVRDDIHISPEQFHCYMTAVDWYILELSRRWASIDKNNVSKYAKSEDIANLMNHLEKTLETTHSSTKK